MTEPHRGFFPTGKMKEFAFLFFPILLMTFSSCLFLLVEKVLLARLSVEEMEAAITVAYICQIFQIVCISLAMMAQVSVAGWYGAQKWKTIGPGIWQFIWFSFLSMFLTIPVGLTYGNYFLAQTPIQEIARPYFYFLSSINFVYPLGTALSCFYLGQGKTRLVLIGSVGAQVLKLALAVPLILGCGSWIPSFGLLGGAISTLLAQGGYCAVLFGVFFWGENREKFASNIWRFQPKLFWECIQPGILRATNRILNVTCWASVAQLMAAKGGDYLIILSIGGALSLFLPFLGDAICQTQTIIVSQIIGARKFDLLGKAFFSGILLSLVFIVITSIILVGFSNFTFEYLFTNVPLNSGVVQRVFLGVWISFAFYTFGYVGISYILAFKDMNFSLLMGAFNWINGYLLMYIALEKIKISADMFWLVHSIMHGSTTLLYFLRTRTLCSRAIATTRLPQST
jgi:Na+-driven multidrug efflux pump